MPWTEIHTKRYELHAILHQLCNNPVYEVEDLYAPDGHVMFRKMVAEHFALQVISMRNF